MISCTRNRGLAIPLALLTGVVLLIFCMALIQTQKISRPSSQQADVRMVQRFVAEGGIQHALLKIKELRQEFYDALTWSGEYMSLRNVPGYPPAGVANKEDFGLTHPAYNKLLIKLDDPMSQTADSRDAGFRYLAMFVNDISSTDRSSQAHPGGYNFNLAGGEWENNSSRASMFDKELGDPFSASYVLKQPMGSRNGFTAIKPAFLTEGLTRLSTKVLDTGKQYDPSDDTEEDSIQIIVLADLVEPESNWTRMSKESNRIEYKKIEKIERSRR